MMIEIVIMTTMVIMTAMMVMNDAAAASNDDGFMVIRLHYDYDCGADQDLGFR